jgi:uncharacterized protein YndB with AHSA1/START domain
MASGARRLRVSQLVRGARAEVFRAFSDPELARKWAPAGCRMVSFEADMRVGGAFREAMSCNGARYVAHGVYRRIIPGKEVVFTHQWAEKRPVETLVTVSFRAAKGATEIVLRQSGFREAADAAGHAVGWSSALARFAKSFASWKKRAAIAPTRARLRAGHPRRAVSARVRPRRPGRAGVVARAAGLAGRPGPRASSRS